MGAGGFHGRVRDGIGCGPPAKATRSSSPSEIGLNEVLVSSGSTRGSALRAAAPVIHGLGPGTEDKLRMISMHGRITSSIGRLGPVSFTRYRASTSGLST